MYGASSKLRNARFSATDIPRTQPLPSGSSVSRCTPRDASPYGCDRSAARDAQFPGLRFALAGEHLDQFALAVAGDAGDADDLAGAHG